MAGLKRQLQHHSHDEHSKCVLQEAEPALKRLRITEADVQGHSGLQLDQQQHHHQGLTQQQQHHQLQQQQQHPSSMLDVPACDAQHQHLGYPFNSTLRQLHMERLQRLSSVGSEQHVPGTPS